MASSGTRTSGESEPLPDWIAPQLATLAKKLPPAVGWVNEIKFDGYRFLTRIEGGKARLFTRGRNDWTGKLPSLAAELAALPTSSAWLDGEAVWLDSRGLPSFGALQNAFDRSREASIVMFLFDVMFLDGVDLRARPQSERSAVLQKLLAAAAPSSRVRLSSPLEADAASALRAACELGLEGVIAKRLDAPYESTRSRAWIKLKCLQRQEFVVGGFTLRDGAVGEYDDAGQLVPAGSVGTGWDGATAKSLHDALVMIETETSSFSGAHSPGKWSKRVKGSERWVEPRLAVDIAFQERTTDGSVRHASFKGVRVAELTVPLLKK